MRKITEIILHCSATREGRDFRAKDINNWHLDRGFKSIGYHYVIGLDGKIEEGRPESETGAHCLNHNSHSIGICYIGGLDEQGKPKDTRTSEQRKALISLISDIRLRYPSATIHGHNEFANKACPCFDVKKEFAV